jgi:hypothetical protein
VDFADRRGLLVGFLEDVFFLSACICVYPRQKRMGLFFIRKPWGSRITWINFALLFTDRATIVFFKGGNMPIQQLIYIIAVVAGIIVLIKPEYLKHIVGGFLIAFGVLGLFTIARARIHIQNLIYLLAIVAGIVIFIKPHYMKYLVGGFLIAFGVLGFI